MNGAFFTGRFPGTKHATVDPLDRIFPEFAAFITQRFPSMHGFTIDADHRDERLLFKIKPIFHHHESVNVRVLINSISL
jgi:hypothetical protein